MHALTDAASPDLERSEHELQCFQLIIRVAIHRKLRPVAHTNAGVEIPPVVVVVGMEATAASSTSTVLSSSTRRSAHPPCSCMSSPHPSRCCCLSLESPTEIVPRQTGLEWRIEVDSSPSSAVCSSSMCREVIERVGGKGSGGGGGTESATKGGVGGHWFSVQGLFLLFVCLLLLLLLLFSSC